MQHDFNLPANGSQQIDVTGRFFKYKSGSGLIRLRASRGGYIDLLPGQGVENEAFTSLTVQDRTGAPNKGVLLAGDFDFRDERISGSVEVIDGGYARTLAGKAFMGVASHGADPALVTGVQLSNPAGSGRNLIVKRYSMSTAAGGGVHVRINQQILTQVNDTGSAKNPLIADSLAQLRVDKLAGVASYFNGKKVDQYSLTVNGSAFCVLQEPIMIPPGWTLTFHALAANIDMTAAVEWYEEIL